MIEHFYSQTSPDFFFFMATILIPTLTDMQKLTSIKTF